jgi:hypothetical protein
MLKVKVADKPVANCNSFMFASRNSTLAMPKERSNRRESFKPPNNSPGI